MAPRNKRQKGKTVKLTEFVDDHLAEDVYDYVDDSWMTEEQAKEAKLAEKIGKREYSRTANNALCEQESFRNTTGHQSAADEMIAQLEPPFVAHFGNLRNGLNEDVFLTLFNPEVVKTHRMIKQDGKTFAFVEFSSANALAVALCMDKTVQHGRQMYVNLANKKQIDRLLDLDGDSTGSPNHRGLGSLSRDAFGSTNNLAGSGMTSPLSRDMFGANSPTGGRPEVEITRDIIGSAAPEAEMDSPASPMSFDNWRSTITPVTEEAGEKKKGGKPSRGDSWRSPDIASPVTKESWRSSGDNAKTERVEKAPPRNASPKGGEQTDSSAPKRVFADGASWRKEGPSAEGLKRGGNANSNAGKGNAAAAIKRNDSTPSDDRWGNFRSN